MFADTRLVVDDSGCECDSKQKWVYVKFISLNCYQLSWFPYLICILRFVFFFPQENDYVIVQSTITNPSPSRTFFMSLRRITESLRSCKGVWNGYWPTERWKLRHGGLFLWVWEVILHDWIENFLK